MRFNSSLGDAISYLLNKCLCFYSIPILINKTNAYDLKQISFRPIVKTTLNVTEYVIHIPQLKQRTVVKGHLKHLTPRVMAEPWWKILFFTPFIILIVVKSRDDNGQDLDSALQYSSIYPQFEKSLHLSQYSHGHQSLYMCPYLMNT